MARYKIVGYSNHKQVFSLEFANYLSAKSEWKRAVLENPVEEGDTNYKICFMDEAARHPLYAVAVIRSSWKHDYDLLKGESVLSEKRVITVVRTM